jgi:two-component system sensor histidine kinase QseC
LTPPRTVRADRRRLKQVVLILLDNAIKYGTAGGVVQVGVREASGRVELRVENDLAAPYEDRPARAFGRFHRGTNTAGVPGVGLGLTIARRIVEKLGGQLELAAVGGGTRMRVTLRFAAGAAA